jgi:uncharacterized protein (DUF302 family)
MKTPNGVIIQPSPYPVKETIDRLQSFLQQHGATIYARIDQQAEVRKVGQNMPALEFIMFGNPAAGGPILTENPIAALDLPLKIIAWENNQHEAFIAFNRPAYIEERYSFAHNPNSPLNLESLVFAAMKP